MTTHGDILVTHDSYKEYRQWLHAYSDGHAEQAFRDVVQLPRWYAMRAIAAHNQKDPSLGKGWLYAIFVVGGEDIRDWIEPHGAFISNLICAMYVGRWCPMLESEAPWHTVGQQPSVEVSCSLSSMIVKGYKRRKKIDFVDEVVKYWRKH